MNSTDSGLGGVGVAVGVAVWVAVGVAVLVAVGVGVGDWVGMSVGAGVVVAVAVADGVAGAWVTTVSSEPDRALQAASATTRSTSAARPRSKR